VDAGDKSLALGPAMPGMMNQLPRHFLCATDERKRQEDKSWPISIP
jgi:hypothetical protein